MNIPRIALCFSVSPRRLAAASLLWALCSTLALTITVRAESAVGRVVSVTNFVSEKAAAGYFPLASATTVADVFVDAEDWQVAQIAARDLTADVEHVTGRKPPLKQTTAGLSENAVLVGTLGKSPVIDRLVKEGRLEVTDVQGQWESFVIATVTDPLPGVRRALVIVGSDRRGTAYGVYELSKRIGVSPWYWWGRRDARTPRDSLCLAGAPAGRTAGGEVSRHFHQ